MPAHMFRVPASVVRPAGKLAFVQDNGVLQAAPPGSTGWHLFTEVGAGVKALALIGIWHEVLNWLAQRSGTGIDNRIADLPEVYMGVGIYKPGERFIGCFPVNDTVVQFVKNLQDFVPGNIVTDIGSIFGFFIEQGGKLLEARKRQTEPSVANAPAIVTFHYLPGKGMNQIGTRKVSYEAIHPLVVKGLSALV